MLALLLVSSGGRPSALAAQYRAAPQWESTGPTPVPMPDRYAPAAPAPAVGAGFHDAASPAAEAVVYGGLFTLGMTLNGIILGRLIGLVHASTCFEDSPRIGAQGGIAVGLSAIPVILAWSAARGRPAGREAAPAAWRRKPAAQRLLQDVLVFTAAGASIGAVGGALEAIGSSACAGNLRTTREGALLFGAAGLATSPLWFLNEGR